MLVDQNWRGKLVDFGLSKVLAEQRMTETTGVANNPVWLAPEVLSGGQATAASDVYAFGLVGCGALGADANAGAASKRDA